ncbi:MAG: 30S ribosomal protein S9 [Planctomycetota bacterium]|jgi:small subunit ribosomal protein S9
MTETETPAAPAVRIKEGEVIWGTGRRKSSVARVRLMLGTGRILVNHRTIEDFFPGEKERLSLLAPLKAVDGLTRYDVLANVRGGGFTGQSGALRLGIARALRQAEENVEEVLKDQGHLTRDSRMKERKKYGLRGARRAFQFSKR